MTFRKQDFTIFAVEKTYCYELRFNSEDKTHQVK